MVDPIDMRADIDSLPHRIQNNLVRSPCDGSAYAFHNHRLTQLQASILLPK